MNEQVKISAMDSMAETTETGINGWSGFSEFYRDLKDKKSAWSAVWQDGVEVYRAGLDVHKKGWRREMNLSQINVAREIFALKRTIEGETLFAIGYDTDLLNQAELVKERAERVLIERMQNYMGKMESVDLRREHGGNVRKIAEGILQHEYRTAPQNEVMERFVSETYSGMFPTAKPDKEEQVRRRKPVWAVGLMSVALALGMGFSNPGEVETRRSEPTPGPTSVLASNDEPVAEMFRPAETEIPQPTKTSVAPTPVPTQEVVKPPEVKQDIWGWLKLKAGGKEIDLSKDFSITVPTDTALSAGKKSEIKMSGEISVNTVHDPASKESDDWAAQFDNWLAKPDLIGVQQGNNMRPILRPHAGDLWVTDFQGDWVRTAAGEIDPKTGKPKIIGKEIEVTGQNGETIKARVVNVVVVKQDAFVQTNRWFPDQPGWPMMWDVSALTNKDNILWDGKTGKPEDPAIASAILTKSGFDFVVCGKPGYASADNLHTYYSVMSVELVEPPVPVNPLRNKPVESAQLPGTMKMAAVNYVTESEMQPNFQKPEISPEHLVNNQLAQDAIELSEVVNEYKDSHIPEDSEKLGQYIRKSDWYGGLPEDKQQKIEPVLRRVDDDTNKYSDLVTGEAQPIQCLRYQSLLAALGDADGPRHNLGGAGTEVVFPGDALGTPEYFKFKPMVAENVKLEDLRKGQLLITKTHVMTVVSSMQTEFGWEVVLADANANADGRARVISVTSSFELPAVLGSQSVWME